MHVFVAFISPRSPPGLQAPPSQASVHIVHCRSLTSGAGPGAEQTVMNIHCMKGEQAMSDYIMVWATSLCCWAFSRT